MLLLVDLHDRGYAIAGIFFGLWLLPLGYLALRSGLFPRALGVLLLVAGGTWIVDTLLGFLLPDLPAAVHTILTLPTLAEFWMVAYLLVKGVREHPALGWLRGHPRQRPHARHLRRRGGVRGDGHHPRAVALTTFPDIRAARTVENSLYLVILLLWVAHTLALYRALRRTGPGPALLGSVLSIVGLAVLAAGALPHVATAPLSDLYHAAGATPQDQATLVLVWHGIEAVFDALLVTGLVVVPLGLLALGKVMLGAPAFGRGLGRTTVALGVVGLAAATAALVGVPPSGAAGVLALVVFHLVVGWRLRRLPRARAASLAPAA